MFSIATPERVQRYHVWRTERSLAAMYARTGAGTQPLPPGTMTAVISLAGMTMKHVDKAFLQLVKMLSSVECASPRRVLPQPRLRCSH